LKIIDACLLLYFRHCLFYSKLFMLIIAHKMKIDLGNDENDLLFLLDCLVSIERQRRDLNEIEVTPLESELIIGID